MGEAEIAKLLSDGAIQSVRKDAATAKAEIEMARTHIAAALQIADFDPTLAFTGLYDGMRKAIQAHMRANGYRTSKGPGAHVKTGSYAAAALDGLAVDQHLEEFETLRV